jgi:hypothetical protein
MLIWPPVPDESGQSASPMIGQAQSEITPEVPPGFVVRTEAEKATWANGFRVKRGSEGGWLHFGSTTSKCEVWVGGVSKDGPWLLSLDRPEIGIEIGTTASMTIAGPGSATFLFDRLTQLYAALERAYRLGLSLPDLPLRQFQAAVATMPRTTEVERLVVQRIGQNLFRAALIAYWDSRCPLTGISDPALLRASHIVPWAECQSDDQRLDVHNGLLLSALWDAAFDAGLVGFGDDGSVLASSNLSDEARGSLGLEKQTRLSGITPDHAANLHWHRARYGLGGGRLTANRWGAEGTDA